MRVKWLRRDWGVDNLFGFKNAVLLPLGVFCLKSPQLELLQYLLGY